MPVTIDLDAVACRRVPLKLVEPLVRKVGGQVERRARTMVRVKSGAVRNSIRSETRVTSTKVIKTIAAHHERSLLEHQGARPHDIDQRPRGPMLTFYWSKVGSVVHFSHVNHPGTQGSKFLTSPLIRYGLASGFKVTISVGGLSGTITS